MSSFFKLLKFLSFN